MLLALHHHLWQMAQRLAVPLPEASLLLVSGLQQHREAQEVLTNLSEDCLVPVHASDVNNITTELR